MTDVNQAPPEIGGRDQLRVDLAWKWFSYHAEQRMKAFNFMILTFGVLATAVVTCLDRGLNAIGFFVSLVSVLVAFLFSRLDIRNEHLVDAGRTALIALEKSLSIGDPTGAATLDIVTTIYKKPVETKSNWVSDLMGGRHRVVLRAFAYLFVGLFAVGMVASFVGRGDQLSRSKQDRSLFCVASVCR